MSVCTRLGCVLLLGGYGGEASVAGERREEDKCVRVSAFIRWGAEWGNHGPLDAAFFLGFD